MFFYFWEIIIDLFENAIFIFFSFSFFSVKSKYKAANVAFISVFIMTCIELIINYYNMVSVMSVPLGLILRIIILLIFFLAKWSQASFFCVLFTLIGILSEGIALVPASIFKIDVSKIYNIGSTRLVLSFMYILILSVIVFTISSVKNNKYILNSFEIIIFLVISIVSIFIEQLLLVGCFTILPSDNLYKITLVIFFLVMFLYWTMIFYIYQLGITRNKMLLLEKEKIANSLERNQYEIILSTSKEIRGMYHDFKRHLNSINSYISSNNYDGVQSYIKDIDNSLTQSQMLISTGNIVIDSIITHSLNLAFIYNIKVNHSIFLPNKIEINDTDLCSILSNILDNAIEACRITDTDKTIDLSIKPFNDMIMINVKNSCNGIYLRNLKGELLTTKNDRTSNLHGIGINRVKDLVAKYNGVISIDPNETYFEVKILLPQ